MSMEVKFRSDPAFKTTCKYLEQSFSTKTVKAV